MVLSLLFLFEEFDSPDRIVSSQVLFGLPDLVHFVDSRNGANSADHRSVSFLHATAPSL